MGVAGFVLGMGGLVAFARGEHEQAEWQSMVSGEEIQVASKHVSSTDSDMAEKYIHSKILAFNSHASGSRHLFPS